MVLLSPAELSRYFSLFDSTAKPATFLVYEVGGNIGKFPWGSEPEAWAPGSSLTLKEKEPSLQVCLLQLVDTAVRVKMSIADLGTLPAQTALHRADSQIDE